MKTRHLNETLLDIAAPSCSISLDVCGISALIVVTHDSSPPFGLKDDASHGQLQLWGGNPLYGLYGDVPLDRVWFLPSLS